MNKKGQLGIILLLGVALVIIVVLLLIPKGEKVVDISSGPEELVSFTQSCLDQSLKQALYIVGMHGGYPHPEEFKYSPKVQESEGVKIGSWMVPYWIYADKVSGTAYKFFNNIPPLCSDIKYCPINSAGKGSIEEAVENTAEERFVECINHYESLKQRFDIKELSKPKVDVQFNKDITNAKLSFDLKYLDLSTGDKGEINTFSTQENIKMPSLYLAARDIATAEANITFIEDVVLHVMSIYQGVGEPLPPFREAVMGFKNDIWLRSDVKDKIKTNVLPYIALINIVNAWRNFHPVIINITKPSDYYAQGFYAYFDKNLGNDSDYRDLSISFAYPGTDFYLDFGGKEVLKPRRADVGGFLGKLVGSLLIEDYRFYYTMAFPVLVTLNDPDAFNGEGYTFNYALEGNIVRNNPINVSINYTPLKITTNMLDLQDRRYFLDSSITINVADKYYHTPIDGALVNYECAGMTFYLGKTTVSGSRGYWQGRMPYCPIGGLIRVTHPDYKESVLEFNNGIEGISKNINMGLWKLQNKTIIIMKRNPSDLSNLSGGGTAAKLLKYRHPLGENDTALIEINRHKDHSEEDDFPLMGFVVIDKKPDYNLSVDTDAQELAVTDAFTEGNITLDQMNDMLESINNTKDIPVLLNSTPNYMMLVPGTYNLSGFLIYKNNIHIPKKKICVLKIGVCIKSKTLPEKNFTQWMTGMMNLSNVQFSPADIYSDKDIIIYLPDHGAPLDWWWIEHYKTDASRRILLPRFEKVSNNG